MKSRKFLSLCLLSLSLISFSSCSNDHIEEVPLEKVFTQDKYRSIYQIFPYSFADSDKDGIGDLKGIIDKFDYIKDLNYTGLWLTPVHPSSTYHKYDVDDYKAIDPKFGTLDDYDKLVKKCHDNNMTILMDLVFNHTSIDNIWFQKCIAAHIRNLNNDPYYNYYNVIDASNGVPSGYTKYGNLAYESRFRSEMPDLNLQDVLDNPNGNLANDLKEIMRFWLIDHNIDGFRLDAVTSYFTGSPKKNTEFLTWLNETVKDIKPSAYIVGEASWGNSNENKEYYTSGIDSFFMFEDAQTGGYVSSAIIQQNSTYLEFACRKNLEVAGKGIPAPFVANHDTGRMCGTVLGRGNSNNVKFGHGILSMLNGTIYNYYGDEIGMAVATGSSSTQNIKDEDKRQPLNWGDEYTCKPVQGSSRTLDEDKYPFGSVQDQLKDDDSILKYVSKANLIRNNFDEIARGNVVSEVYTNDFETLSVVKKSLGDSLIYIVVNASHTQELEYDFTNLGDVKVVAELCTNSYVKQSDKNIKKIKIPSQGIAILK